MNRKTISRLEFEELVFQAWDEIPVIFQERIENLAVVVEDMPSVEDLQKLGISSPYQLLGMYRGVPLTRRGIYSGFNMMPDVIVIFRKPILAICRTIEQVRRQVRETLAHEIGHYFGLDEEAVRSAMGDYLLD